MSFPSHFQTPKLGWRATERCVGNTEWAGTREEIVNIPHAKERRGTTLGVIGLLLLAGLGLVVLIYAPSRDGDDTIHSAAAVSW
jgi:hypothetical protein